MTKVAFVDTETTGLDPRTDSVVEVAIIVGDEEKSWWIELTDGEISRASAQALAINHYWERSEQLTSLGERTVLYLPTYVSTNFPDARKEAARDIALFTTNAVLAGFNVKFDQAFLEQFLRSNGAAPAWNYRVIDVATYAAGALAALGTEVDPPFSSTRVAEAMKLPDIEEGYAHTALGDARYSKLMYEATPQLKTQMIEAENESASQAGQPEKQDEVPRAVSPDEGTEEATQ